MFNTKVNISIFDNDNFTVKGSYYKSNDITPNSFECLEIEFKERIEINEMEYRITFFHPQNIKRFVAQLNQALKDIEHQKKEAENKEV